MLPPKKTVVDVFADFLNYLFACTRRFISETHANGESLWNSVKDRIEFVLSHPNGWEGLQQRRMRQASVMAGLIPDTTVGHSRIHFVTEGEASLNFCINNGLATHAMQVGIDDNHCAPIVSPTYAEWERCHHCRRRWKHC